MSLGEHFGRYRIVSRIAAGGMGEVYKGTAVGPHGVEKAVAIKLIRDLQVGRDRMVQMFVEEAKVGFLLNHPNIVQTYELGEIEGTHFLVMEFVDGISLDDLLAKYADLDQTIPQDLSFYIAGQALRALDYAHTLRDHSGAPLRIVHRDISPGNLLISSRGHVKLSDFGLAKSTMRQSQSKVGTVKGKLGYMAPEQFSAGDVDARADIFAFGAMFYEMLCGVGPFGENVSMAARTDCRIVPITERLKHIDPALVALVDGCLAVERADRIADARTVLERLEDCAAVLGYRASDQSLADEVREHSGVLETTTRVGAGNPFDRVLGMELAKVATANGVGTFIAELSQPSVESDATVPSSAPTQVAPDSIASAGGSAGSTGSAGSMGSMVAPPKRKGPLLFAVLLVLAAIGGVAAYLMRGDSHPAAATVDAGTSKAATDAAPVDVAPTPKAPPVPDASPRRSPDLAPAKPDTRPQPKRPRPKRPRPKRPRKAVDPVAFGSLSVNSEPWSHVFVDGKKIGTTPVIGHRIAAGKHRIRLHNPVKKIGYAGTVTVKADAHHKLSKRLK